MKYIRVVLGGRQVGKFRFRNLGTYEHARALDKAIRRVVELLGSDCFEDAHKYLEVVSESQCID